MERGREREERVLGTEEPGAARFCVNLVWEFVVKGSLKRARGEGV
jgi:hypothetical protein